MDSHTGFQFVCRYALSTLRGMILIGLALWLMCSMAFASIAVIGNLELQVTQLTHHEVENIYLGKSVQLPTHEKLLPVNQPDNSAIYAEFYRSLLGWSKGYWSLVNFQGKSPPTQVANDAAVIAMVENTPHAIGYISGKSLSQVIGHAKVLYGLDGIVIIKKVTYSSANTKPLLAAVTPPAPIPAKAAIKKPAISNTAARAVAVKEMQEIDDDLYQRMQARNDTPADNSNFWPTLVSHYSLGDYTDRPEVQHEIIAYLSHKKMLNEILQNSVPYIYYVYQQTQARQMPAEFALLPLLESGYDPFSYSSAGATGLWQLMPGTASGVGLDINWWYDARRDTVVSTQAALNFLRALHAMVHDWLLTAASYDVGVNAVQAAQQYNARNDRDTHFWSLPLPTETRYYVPKLLALAAIIKNPAYYGVHLPPVPNHPYFSAINMNSQIDLAEASYFSGVTPDVIHRLNPGLLRWATNPDGVYTLLVPAGSSAQFEKNLQAVAGKVHLSWQYHEIRSGETLSNIAKNYHTSMALLEQVNGLAADELVPNQGLLVPLNLQRTYSLPIAVSPNNPVLVSNSISANVPDQLTPVLAVDSVPATANVPSNGDGLKLLLGKIYNHSASP